MSQLKDDLTGLKSRLENIELEFESKLKDVESKESKFKQIDEHIEELINKKDSIVKLNVGGKIFQTKISTLLSVKDTLFYKIVSANIESNNTDLNKEIFFDRGYTYFPLILDYLRSKRYSLKEYSKFELDDIREEASFYGIQEILDFVEETSKEIEFVRYESSGRYSTAGTMELEGLKDKSLTRGICVQSPYWILIELNFEHEFEKIEVGGWNGNSSLWYVGNGQNANILTSKDKVTWKDVGKLPSNLGATIQTVSLTRSSAKYIKFQHTSYLGLGYLNILRIS